MKNLFTIILSLVALSAFSQKLTLQGRATDETGGGLPGAHIALLYPWGEEARLSATESDGRFTITEIEKGGYKIKISFLGYEDFIREITLSDESLDLGILQLQPSATQLTEIQVKERLAMAKQNGDTTAFNADAFKVMKDASAEDLVGKMPTVSVQDGKVQAQGEEVKQVLVDGKPFFGNDPTAALKNLPAEVIEKIQIYDQASDQSQFTGFDDGNSSKTINIITRSNMRAGQFGKIYGGYGHEEKWQGGGNINYFSGDRRISLIGMTNNVNIQNFSKDDLLGVMGSSGSRGGRRGGRGDRGSGSLGDFLINQSGGIATTHAFGVNYSDKWGEKMEVSGSYFFNKNKNYAESYLTQQFVDAEGEGQVYDETSFSTSYNTNHRANFRLEYEIDSSNSIIMRPSLSWQLNNGHSNTMGVTSLNDSLLNTSASGYFSDLGGLNFNNNLLWRHKFSKRGRTFSINISSGYAPKKGDSKLQSTNAFFGMPGTFDTLDQVANLDSRSWNMSANLNYTEPVGESGQLMLEYRAGYQEEESAVKTYDYAEVTQGYDNLNEPLSNVFSNDYYTHRPGIGYNYRKNRNLMIMGRASVQHARLLNDQTFPQLLETDKTFTNFLPFAMLRWDINGRQKNLRLFYRTNTDLPSIEQLQNVLDNSNPLQLKIGNPKLGQSYSHSLNMRYQATNTEKSTVFFAMFGLSLTNNYIANGVYLANSRHPIFDEFEIERGSQLTQPVNLSGHRSLRSFVTYGLPLGFIKSNLNIDFNWNFSKTPGLLNEDLNFANTHTFGTGLTLSSNISEKIDFTISGRPNYSTVKNSLQTSGNNAYLSFNSSVRFNWVMIDGFILRTDLANQIYTGLSDDFNQHFWLWNLGIGKKLFKNERGEITLSINDLLNQNRNINRTITEVFIQDTQTNALTRYVLLTFTYNLRHFGSSQHNSWNGQDARENKQGFGRD